MRDLVDSLQSFSLQSWWWPSHFSVSPGANHLIWDFSQFRLGAYRTLDLCEGLGLDNIKYRKEILSASRYIEMITIIKRELTISGPSNVDINVVVGEISDQQTSTKRLIHLCLAIYFTNRCTKSVSV